MPRCASCHGKIGLLAKKFTGYSGEPLCRVCALRQQRHKLAERLEYRLKAVAAYPDRIEPLRDCEKDMHLAEGLLASDHPFSAGSPKEIERIEHRYRNTPPGELMQHKPAILESCKSLVERLKRS